MGAFSFGATFLVFGTAVFFFLALAFTAGGFGDRISSSWLQTAASASVTSASPASPLIIERIVDDSESSAPPLSPLSPLSLFWLPLLRLPPPPGFGPLPSVGSGARSCPAGGGPAAAGSAPSDAGLLTT